MEKAGDDMKFKKRIFTASSPSRIITLVFAALVLFGSGLLSLPFASRSGQSCGFLTALFTACSAVCVTGLSLVDTYTQWSGFGQAVILLLIQVGGLGFMTIFTLFLLILRERIGVKRRMLLQQSFGLNDMAGVIHLLHRVLYVTAITELGGAVILTLRFCRDYPIGSAVWLGVFHSVSAFCNAGFDLFGISEPGSSLILYSNDWIVCLTVMTLVTVGGLGFFVWQDLYLNRKNPRHISVYTRLVLCISAVLVVGGALIFGALEWNNPDTLGQKDIAGKLFGALFQSVTTRTAGFSGIPQAKMTQPSQAISCIWMLIGGSSGSTAGGMKTVTVGVLLLSAIRSARGKSRLTVFDRTINEGQITMAGTIVTLMVSLSLFGAIIITIADRVDFLPALFEATSALGTVGLTADLTPTLCIGSKLMLVLFMFFGRVGITTISMGFLLGERAEERFHYAETKLLIG